MPSGSLNHWGLTIQSSMANTLRVRRNSISRTAQTCSRSDARQYGNHREGAAVSRLRLLQAAADAEKSWMLEVQTAFGTRDASYARYQDRAMGEPGSRLRELYDAYMTARDAYAATK